MNAATATKRNSRWTRSPTFGARKTAHLSQHDIAIFAVLARYRYLPADYISALVGGNFKHLIHRLNVLSRAPNLFVDRPPQQRANANANHRPLIYELDERGARVLQEHGFDYERTRPPASFAHELMVCQIMASFELGARATDLRLITWPDILRHDRLPETTRQSPKPCHIPISVSVDGQRIDTHVAADGNPFGVARPIDDRPAYYFFPGIEADCGTEPVDASDFARSSIYKKFVLYLAVEAQGVHRSHFGFLNFYVPVITTNETRARSMMEVLSRITDGAGSKIFLFKTFPAFHVVWKAAPAIRPHADRGLATGRQSPVQLPHFLMTMTDKPPAVDIVAAREHSINSRRTRVHVIVCHDLNARAHSLYEMFRFADRVSPEVLAALTRDLASDIIRDADMLIAELEGIKAFANRELAKLSPLE